MSLRSRFRVKVLPLKGRLKINAPSGLCGFTLITISHMQARISSTIG